MKKIILFLLFLLNNIGCIIYSYNLSEFENHFTLSPKSEFIEIFDENNLDDLDDSKLSNIDLGDFLFKFSYDFENAFINILDVRIPVTYEELRYYQGIIEESLTKDNKKLLKKLLINLGVSINTIKVKTISIKTVPDKLDAGAFYVWKIDIVLNDGKIFEAVIKVVIGQNNINAVQDVLKAHRVLQDKEIIPDLYLYTEYEGEHIFFVEYIKSEKYLKDDEVIALKTFFTWYYSSKDSNKRWIFGDGDDTSRGNIRFFKQKDGIVDARIVDNENHQFYPDLKSVYEYLINVRHDAKKVTNALNKFIVMFPELSSSFKISNNINDISS